MRNVNGKERLIDPTKTGRERIYLTHEANGHEIPEALGNPIPRGRRNPSIAVDGNQPGVGATVLGAVVLFFCEACRARRGSSMRTWGPAS